MAVDLRAPETYQALLSSATPTETLKAIGEALIAEKDKSEKDKFGDAPFLWRLLALNPALPSSLAENAAKKSPGDFLINPAFPLLAMENPATGNPKPDMVAQSYTPFSTALVLLKRAIEGTPVQFVIPHNILTEAFELAVKLREGPAMYHLGQALYEASRNHEYKESMRKTVRSLIGVWPLDCLPLLYAMLDVPDGYVPQPAPDALEVMRASVTLDAPPPADPRSTADMGICLPHGHPWHAVAEHRSWFDLNSHMDFVHAAQGYYTYEGTATRIAEGVRRHDAFAVCIALMAIDADNAKPMWSRLPLATKEIIWAAVEPFLGKDACSTTEASLCRRLHMQQHRAWTAVEAWLKSPVTSYTIPVSAVRPPDQIRLLSESVLRDWCALEEWPWKGHDERQYDRNHMKAKAILWMQALAERKPQYASEASLTLRALIEEMARTADLASLARQVPEAIPAMVDSMMAAAAAEE